MVGKDADFLDSWFLIWRIQESCPRQDNDSGTERRVRWSGDIHLITDNLMARTKEISNCFLNWILTIKSIKLYNKAKFICQSQSEIQKDIFNCVVMHCTVFSDNIATWIQISTQIYIHPVLNSQNIFSMQFWRHHNSTPFIS